MPTHVVSFDSLSEVLASCFHDRDWYFEVISHTDKNNYCFFHYANYLSFPSHWTILTFVRYALFHFIQFLWKHNSFMWIFAFRRKKLERNFAFSTTAICIYFASLTLICKLPFIGEFRWRQKCHLWFLRCLPFWTSCLFWDFLSFTSDFLFQLFNAGKIWEMLQLNKVTHRALRQHNLIFLVSFVLLLSPKQSKCLTSFHLQLIGGIWLAQKFAFNIDKFQ